MISPEFNMLAAPTSLRGTVAVSAPGGDLAEMQRSFSAVLGRARDIEQTPEERAREAAEQLVSQTFLLPMLKEIRESDRTAPPFAPSRSEKQFRALMDAELAQRLVKAGSYSLVDRLARDLLNLASAGGTEQTTQPAAAGATL